LALILCVEDDEWSLLRLDLPLATGLAVAPPADSLVDIAAFGLKAAAAFDDDALLIRTQPKVKV